MVAKASLWGVLGFVSLLAVYFGLVSLVSGPAFALDQFRSYWYFIIALALGFGIQVGLYAFLRLLVKGEGSGKVVAASGTTSAAAMIACCAHYLANLLPVLGVTGFVTLVAQYQIGLFWIGLLVNLAAILFIAPRAVKAYKEHRCELP